MKNKILSLLFLSIIAVIMASKPAFADTTPGFPSCLNPQGTIIAQYMSGIHGIAGQSETYTGKDTVYKISNEAVMQCFCDDNGQGIQTNWWRISNLNDADIEAFKSTGWIWIPSGDAWGLDSVPYLAQNSSYTCGNSNQGTTTSSTSGPVESIALTANTITNQLASTGNIIIIYTFLSIGIILFLTGLFLRRIKK